MIRKYRDDLVDDDEARETGVGSELAEKIKRRFKEKTDIEEDNFVRFPESKKDKMWQKSLIRRHERSNPLFDELKDIEAIKQIFTEKKAEDLSSKIVKRKKETHKPKAGAKKRKME